MNAETILPQIDPAPTLATDAALFAKWAAAQDDGNAPHLTLAELRRLIELTRSPRDRADLLDAYVCELEASGTDADVRALDPTALSPDDGDCTLCSGTGEGIADGLFCPACNGRGFIPADACDDGDLAWLDDAYAAMVAADEWARA